MPAEEIRSDNVIAFPRPQMTAEAGVEGKAEAGASRGAVPDADPEAGVSPTLTLNAERGIINTGIVHGGQHVTAIEFSGQADSGVDGGVNGGVNGGDSGL
ncbi:S-type pyocin domain-containing protein [Streptomyces flavofungini]|uniref:S-type pyocin domain-containing protein n=1 Tax=Streptomyces flavofungini TaxID=68200 RepID=UPI0034DF6FB7